MIGAWQLGRQPPRGPAEPRVTCPPQSLGRGRRVLVIEDSEVIRRVLGLILEAEGFQVEECAAGRAALAMARKVQPDVITLDLGLPDMDGRELLHALRADSQVGDVPVVVVSAYADSLPGRDLQLAADVMVKPFDLDDLLTRLDRAASGLRLDGLDG